MFRNFYRITTEAEAKKLPSKEGSFLCAKTREALFEFFIGNPFIYLYGLDGKFSTHKFH